MGKKIKSMKECTAKAPFSQMLKKKIIKGIKIKLLKKV